jgi:hypothetical protein
LKEIETFYAVFFCRFSYRIKHADLLSIIRPDNEAISGRNRILPDNKYLISGRIGYQPDTKILPDIRPDRGRNRISGAPLLRWEYRRVTVTRCPCVTEVNAIMLSLHFRMQVNTLLPYCLACQTWTHLVVDRHSPLNDTIYHSVSFKYVILN